MNSVEAARILYVLDETLEALRLVSYVSHDVLDTAEQLRDMLGEDLSHALVKHRHLVHTHAHSKSVVTNDVMAASTLELVRLLRKSPSAHRMQNLPYDRSLGILQLLQYMEKLRGFAQKRLTTTVEEDASNREHYEEVREREERAVADRLQLEQKLRLQRVELQKAATLAQSQEDRVRGELHDVSSSAEAAMRNIDTAAARQAEGDRTHFTSEHAALTAELAAAQAQLAALRDEHRAQEGLLRKARKRAEHEVEATIGEYDNDVGSKDAELLAAREAYLALSKQLEQTVTECLDMQRERLEYEEKLRLEHERKLAAALNRIRINHAARTIQRRYRAYRARILAAKKKAAKAAKAKAKKK